MAVGAVRSAVSNYEDVSEADVKSRLKSDLIGASAQIKTKEAYYSFKQPKITIAIKDGDRIFKAPSPTVESELDLSSGLDLSYKTTMSGIIMGFETFGRNQVDLIFVLDDKETKYSVNLSEFK